MTTIPFRAKLASEKLCLTSELSLGGIEQYSDLGNQLSMLRDIVDAVHVPHNARFSPLALSRILLDHNIEPILQISSVNRSFVDLEIEVRAAVAIGVSNIMLVKGEADEQQRTGKLSATAMLAHVSKLRQEIDQNYLLGTVARVFKPAVSWRPTTLTNKVGAGARFIRTQLCFDPKQVKEYLAFLNRAAIAEQAPVIISTSILPSVDAAHWLSKNLKGTHLPASLIKRLETASDPAREGIMIAADFISALQEIPGVGGVSLLTQGNPALVRQVVEQTDLHRL